MPIVLSWLRTELRRRWRSLLVLALLVAISSGVVLTALAGARRGATGLDRLLAQTLPATAAVLPNQPGFDWDAVRQLPQVAAVGTFPITSLSTDGAVPGDYAVDFPPGDAERGNTVERPVVIEGRLADSARADEAVATPAFVSTFGKGIGDTVQVRLYQPETIDAAADGNELSDVPDGPTVPVKIVGVVRGYWGGDTVGSKGELVPSYAFFEQYRANLLGTSGAVYVNALVRLHGGAADLPAFRAELARLTGRNDIDVADLAETAAKDQRVDTFESACLLAFGLAALLAAAVLVGQSIARYTATTVDDLQLLRPMGMTPRQVVVAGSAAPAIVALLGIGLGVAGAVQASRWMPFGAPALHEPAPGLDADWLVLGAGGAILAAAVVGAAAAAAWLTLAAARSGPSQRRSSVAQGAARVGLPIPVVLGTRFALEPGRGRSAVPVRPALLGAVVGVLGVLAAFTFSAGVADAAGHLERFGLTHQLDTFVGLNGQDYGPVGSVLTAAAADPDVAGVNDARSAVATAGDASITLYTHAPVGAAVPTVLTAGRMPATADEVAIGPTTARNIGADVGSVLTVVGNKGTHRETVTGLGFVPVGHNDYDDGGWVTSAGYDSLFDGFKFHSAQIALRPGVDVASATPRLAAAVKDATGADVQFSPVQPVPAVAQVRDVEVLPIVLAGFLALLAVGAVGHALATAVRRRRHDVAVLRAVGMTRWQSRGVVVTQASVLALIGLVVGIPLGLALGRTLWRIVAESTPLLYVPPSAFWALLLIAPLALLVANLLAAPPGRLAARLRISQVLRAE